MNVLLACPGIYQSISSVQRLYEHLISGNPTIEFYFTGERRPTGGAPHNAHHLPLTDIHRRQLATSRASGAGAFEGSGAGLWRHADDLAALLDLAASVPSIHFDVVDIPDSLPLAVYLPAWLRECGVDFDKVALSLHGTASMHWQDPANDDGADLALLREHEDLLYRCCDIRYGLGRQYLADWQNLTGLPARLIDAGATIPAWDPPPAPDLGAGDTDPPALCFIGLPDHGNGADLFIELCSRLPRDLFSDVRIYWTQTAGEQMAELRRMARHRSLELIDEAIASEDLTRRLRDERMVVVLPSRGDPFNLLAVEALLNQCPTVISTRSGASDFINDAWPDLPHVKLDPDNLFGCYQEIVTLLTGYDAARAALGERVAAVAAAPDGASLEEIYAAEGTPDSAARRAVAERVALLAAQVDVVLVEPAERAGATHCPTVLAPHGDAHRGETDFSQALDLARLWRKARPLSTNPAWPVVDEALDRLREHAAGVNRLHLYRLMAQWERGRGNDLLYVAYCLRALRLCGRLPADTLREMTAVLTAAGLNEAAAAAALLVRDGEHEIADWLADRRTMMAQPPAGAHDFIEVNRPSAAKISVIAAVCNDTPKLDRFIADIERLTDEERAICEFVVVDRASIDDSARLIEDRLQQAAQRQIGGLVLRCGERETLGQAWNRGIAAARGDYIAFLAFDQALRPGSLAMLAGCLDRRRDVDWAQGSNVTVDVDRSGVYLRDAGASRRAGGSAFAHYLDAGHIGQLGAVYRNAVHARAGYYDPTLRTAAATEFASRALPFLRVEPVPAALGTQYNYPDDEPAATAAIAEIEALSARHLYRTVGGIRYAFANADAQDCLSQFRRALHLRGRAGADGSDIEYAWNMAEYLRRHRPEVFSEIEPVLPRLAELRLACHRLDDLADPETSPSLKGVLSVVRSLERVGAQLGQASAATAAIGVPANYQPRCDSRWGDDIRLWLTAALCPTATSAPAGSDGALSVDLSRPIGGSGWYPAEQVGDHWHRWTGPDPEFSFDVLLPYGRSYRAEALLAPIRPEVAGELWVAINGTIVAHVEEWISETVLLSVPVMRTLDRSGAGLYRIVIRHRTACGPAERGETSDLRRLGFAVRSIGFLPLGRKDVVAPPVEAAEPPTMAPAVAETADDDAAPTGVDAVAQALPLPFAK